MSVPQPNEHGVYLPKQCKSLIFKGNDRHVNARILILKISPEEWKASSEVKLPQSFAGCWPSDKSPSFPTRMDAVMHEAEWIIEHCKYDKYLHDDETSIRSARQIIEWCHSLRQPRLF